MTESLPIRDEEWNFHPIPRKFMPQALAWLRDWCACPAGERLAEVVRHTLARAERWTSPGGTLRGVLRPILKLALLIGLPTLIVGPAVLLLLEGTAAASAADAAVAANLAAIASHLSARSSASRRCPPSGGRSCAESNHPMRGLRAGCACACPALSHKAPPLQLYISNFTAELRFTVRVPVMENHILALHHNARFFALNRLGILMDTRVPRMHSFWGHALFQIR